MEKAAIYEALNEAYFAPDHDEKLVLDQLPRLLEDGAVLVDAGASLGQYTKAMCEGAKNCEITSIEADPVRVEELTRNAEHWAAETSNEITVRHLALTESVGEVPFFVTNSNVSGGLTQHVTQQPVDWEQIEVPSSSLDALFPGAPPDLVKIDVEGAELAVLRGASRIIRERRTLFLVEIHDWPAGSAGAVVDLLRRAGYVGLSFYGQPLFVPSRHQWLRFIAPQAKYLPGRAWARVKNRSSG